MTLFDTMEREPMSDNLPMPEIQSAPQGESIAETSVFLRLKFGLLGNSRKISNSAVEVDADKNLIRVSKKLLESKELDAIRSLDGEIRKYIYNHCLPGFDDGMFFLPYGLVSQVERKLKQFATERAALVEIFLLAYPELCRQAEESLRSVYNRADYPTVEEVRAKFTLSWLYLEIGTPGKLRGIDSALFEESRESLNQTMRNAAEEAQSMMRGIVLDLVEHLQERLSDDPASGKQRIFRDSAVTNLQEFLRLFDARNITNDRQLAAQVQRLREMVSGVDPQDLRDLHTVRDRVRTGMEEVKRQLDGLVVNRTGRKIRKELEQ
jgi:hypothetical protein